MDIKRVIALPRWLFVGLALVSLLAACAPSNGEPSDEGPPSAPPDAGNSGLSAGEVPQVMFDAVVADALSRSGAQRSAVAVEKSEQVQWSDGSLGCPAPGTMYTQAIIDGYQVILSIDNRSYDYHLSDSGYFVLCESGLPNVPVEGTPSQ